MASVVSSMAPTVPMRTAHPAAQHHELARLHAPQAHGGLHHVVDLQWALVRCAQVQAAQDRVDVLHAERGGGSRAVAGDEAVKGDFPLDLQWLRPTTTPRLSALRAARACSHGGGSSRPHNSQAPVLDDPVRSRGGVLDPMLT